MRPLCVSTSTHSSAAVAQRPATTSYWDSRSSWSSIISLKTDIPPVDMPAVAVPDAPPVMAVESALGLSWTAPPEVSAL